LRAELNARRHRWFLCQSDSILVQPNDFKKLYRAKTPRAPKKNIFFELGELCVFARIIVFPNP
jgi:hypothetical protein